MHCPNSNHRKLNLLLIIKKADKQQNSLQHTMSCISVILITKTNLQTLNHELV
jgi:hypothetical protein